MTFAVLTTHIGELAGLRLRLSRLLHFILEMVKVLGKS